MRLIRPSFKIKTNTNTLLALEQAGRVCYKSEDKITEDSAEKFIKMLIRRGHESVLEHTRLCFSISSPLFRDMSDLYIHLYELTKSEVVGVEITGQGNTVYLSLNMRSLRDALRIFGLKNPLVQELANAVNEKYPIFTEDLFLKKLYKTRPRNIHILSNIDVFNALPPLEAAKHINASVQVICDRGVSHEIVRHRVFSFSQESTRYVKYNGDMEFILPPWVDIRPGSYADALDIDNSIDINSRIWATSVYTAAATYAMLTGDEGWKPEQARSVLPNSLKTELVMSATLSNWKHFFSLRAAKPAHPQMRELAYPMLDEFTEMYPTVFQEEI